MKHALHGLLALTLLFICSVSLIAEDRKPAEGATPRGEGKPETDPNRAQRKPEADPNRGERKPDAGTPRGERRPETDPNRGERRTSDRGGVRSTLPEEIKLSDEQQKKLDELQGTVSTKMRELTEKREGILTDGQKAARSEAERKIREGGLGRQEATDLLNNALNLTADQKTQIETSERELNELRQQFNTQQVALLNDAQKSILQKSMIANMVSRDFSLPGEFTLTDDQKTGLKTLQDELGNQLIELMAKHANLLTEERRIARDNAFKAAREANKDRQQTADDVNAALGLTEGERAELAQLDQDLRELRTKIQERKLGLLTAEQKAEFEKRFGAASRSR